MLKKFSQFRALCTLTILIVCNTNIFSQYPVTQFEFTVENENDFNSLPLSNDKQMGLSKSLAKSFPASFSLKSQDNGYLIVDDMLGSCGLRDQGVFCGTCTFFAITAALEIATKRHILEYYNLPGSSFDINLSEAELIYKYNYNGVGRDGKVVGSNTEDVLKKLVSNQWVIPLERYNKYGMHSNVQDCSFSNDISNSSNGGITVTHASRLSTWLSTPDVYTIKSALMRLKGVICVVNIRSDANFTYLDEPDGTFGQNLNHAVCIVGWDDNAGGGSWIVKNSWGSGNNCQYFYMKYGHGRNCMIIDEVVITKPSNFISDIFSGDASLDYDGTNTCNSKPLKWCDGTSGIKIAVAKNYTKKYIAAENKEYCFQNEFRPYDCKYLGSGKYLTDVWAVEFDISYTGTSVSSYDGFSNGKLATASGNCQSPAPYACGIYKINATAKTATLYTFTFQMYDAVGNRFWFPYPPENIQVGYKEYSVPCFKPTINSTSQDITPIINLLLND